MNETFDWLWTGIGPTCLFKFWKGFIIKMLLCMRFRPIHLENTTLGRNYVFSFQVIHQ